MVGRMVERIVDLMTTARCSPVVEEFAEILCRRWLDDVQSDGRREAADYRLIASLEALVEWAAEKGLLVDDVAQSLDQLGV